MDEFHRYGAAREFFRWQAAQENILVTAIAFVVAVALTSAVATATGLAGFSTVAATAATAIAAAVVLTTVALGAAAMATRGRKFHDPR